MLVHLPRIDRKAALLAGYEFGPKPSMELDLASLGPDRERVIKALTINQDGSATLPLDISLPTKEGIIEAIDKREALERQHKEQDAAREAAAEVARRKNEVQWMEGAKGIIEKLKTAEPVPAQQSYIIDGIKVSYAGFVTDKTLSREIPYHLARWAPGEGVGQRFSPDMAATIKEYEDCKAAYEKSVSAADLAAQEAAMPGMVQEAARIKEERRLAFQATLAERLQTGVYQRATDPYNERRYGRPWIAKIVGLEGRKLQYEFGTWFGEDGCAGTLRINCRPGEFFARGQKDFRHPGDSIRETYKMLDDGRVEEVDYNSVVKVFLDREKAEKASRKTDRDVGAGL